MITALTTMFDVEVPLVQAPMAGAASGTLAAAVSRAGALGMIGVGPSTTADWIREQHQVATDGAGGRPFGIGMSAWVIDRQPDQLDAIIDVRPAFVSLGFGDVTPYVARLREAGIEVLSQVGTVAEAVAVERAGVSLVVARGGEGGGHGRNDLATLPLLQQVLDRVQVPVLAAGGISGPRGLAAVLAAGAAGALVGTAFLACPESLTVDLGRERLLAADGTDTVYGRVFDIGQRNAWPAEFGGRALRNVFFDRWLGHEDELADDDEAHASILAARRQLDPTIAPIYAGQGVGALTAARPAAEVVQDFARAADLLRQATLGSSESA